MKRFSASRRRPAMTLPRPTASSRASDGVNGAATGPPARASRKPPPQGNANTTKTSPRVGASDKDSAAMPRPAAATAVVRVAASARVQGGRDRPSRN